MGTSFVTLSSSRKVGPDGAAIPNGIWVNDSILQFVLRLLALHIPEPAPGAEGDDSRDVRDRWLLASGVSFPGCVPHDLEVIAMAGTGLSVARSALISLTSALDDMSPRLPGQLFSLLGMGEPIGKDLSTDDLKAIASDIVGLIDAYEKPDEC